MLRAPTLEPSVAIKKKPVFSPPDDEEATTPHAEQPGERRAVRILTRFEVIQDDPDKSIDAKSMLGDLPELSQRYLALILRNGPTSNVDAANALKVKESVLEPAILQLDRVIEELASDDD